MTDSSTQPDLEQHSSPETLKPIQVVGGVVRNSEGKILIAQRNHGRLNGYWEFPGGKVDPGETEEVALAREFREEFGIEVAVGAFLGENTHVYDETEQYPTVSINLRVYHAQLTSDANKIVLAAHGDHKWVSEDELQEFNFAPADIPLVSLLLKNRTRSEVLQASDTN